MFLRLEDDCRSQFVAEAVKRFTDTDSQERSAAFHRIVTLPPADIALFNERVGNRKPVSLALVAELGPHSGQSPEIFLNPYAQLLDTKEEQGGRKRP